MSPVGARMLVAETINPLRRWGVLLISPIVFRGLSLRTGMSPGRLDHYFRKLSHITVLMAPSILTSSRCTGLIVKDNRPPFFGDRSFVSIQALREFLTVSRSYGMLTLDSVSDGLAIGWLLVTSDVSPLMDQPVVAGAVLRAVIS